MRFIVREQPNEKPIAAGQLRYEREGKPTGAVESWRLTTPIPDYQILRVDLDAREAKSGGSFLFHLVQQETGQPERLGYRYWGSGWMIEGTLLFERDGVAGRRTVNGRTTEEAATMADQAGFWFPTTVGLGIAATLSDASNYKTVTLNNEPGSETTLALKTAALKKKSVKEAETITIARQSMQATAVTLSWQSHRRTVWLEEQHRWPVKMERDDGLTAVETRYIWY